MTIYNNIKQIVKHIKKSSPTTPKRQRLGLAGDIMEGQKIKQTELLTMREPLASPEERIKAAERMYMQGLQQSGSENKLTSAVIGQIEELRDQGIWTDEDVARFSREIRKQREAVYANQLEGRPHADKGGATSYIDDSEELAAINEQGNPVLSVRDELGGSSGFSNGPDKSDLGELRSSAERGTANKYGSLNINEDLEGQFDNIIRDARARGDVRPEEEIKQEAVDQLFKYMTGKAEKELSSASRARSVDDEVIEEAIQGKILDRLPEMRERAQANYQRKAANDLLSDPDFLNERNPENIKQHIQDVEREKYKELLSKDIDSLEGYLDQDRIYELGDAAPKGEMEYSKNIADQMDLAKADARNSRVLDDITRQTNPVDVAADNERRAMSEAYKYANQLKNKNSEFEEKLKNSRAAAQNFEYDPNQDVKNAGGMYTNTYHKKALPEQKLAKVMGKVKDSERAKAMVAAAVEEAYPGMGEELIQAAVTGNFYKPTRATSVRSLTAKKNKFNDDVVFKQSIEARKKKASDPEGYKRFEGRYPKTARAIEAEIGKHLYDSDEKSRVRKVTHTTYDENNSPVKIEVDPRYKPKDLSKDDRERLYVELERKYNPKNFKVTDDMIPEGTPLEDREYVREMLRKANEDRYNIARDKARERAKNIDDEIRKKKSDMIDIDVSITKEHPSSTDKDITKSRLLEYGKDGKLLNKKEMGGLETQERLAPRKVAKPKKESELQGLFENVMPSKYNEDVIKTNVLGNKDLMYAVPEEKQRQMKVANKIADMDSKPREKHDWIMNHTNEWEEGDLNKATEVEMARDKLKRYKGEDRGSKKTNVLKADKKKPAKQYTFSKKKSSMTEIEKLSDEELGKLAAEAKKTREVQDNTARKSNNRKTVDQSTDELMRAIFQREATEEEKKSADYVKKHTTYIRKPGVTRSMVYKKIKENSKNKE